MKLEKSALTVDRNVNMNQGVVKSFFNLFS